MKNLFNPGMLSRQKRGLTIIGIAIARGIKKESTQIDDPGGSLFKISIEITVNLHPNHMEQESFSFS